MEHCNVHVTVQNNYFHNLTASHFNKDYFFMAPVFAKTKHILLHYAYWLPMEETKEEKNSPSIHRKRSCCASLDVLTM
jgi:hypothetical protein